MLTILISLFLLPQNVDEKSSPFDGLRWVNNEPEVLIEEDWYQFIAIDSVPAEKILAYCDGWYPGRVKRFAEDLVPVLQELGWRGDSYVDLDLILLRDGSRTRLADVEMTGEKRRALRASRRVAESPIKEEPLTITTKDAMLDLLAFKESINDQFAYIGLGGVDLDAEVDRISKEMKLLGSESIEIETLANELHKLMMQFGDGHARVSANSPTGSSKDKYLPFLLMDSTDGVVAILPDRTDFFEPSSPITLAIDGLPIEDWVKAMEPLVAKGSSQLIRRRSLGALREIDAARRLLGLESGGPLIITLTSKDKAEEIELDIAISSSRPTYGSWPISSDSMLQGNIGYLRIPEMNGNVGVIHKAMGNFSDTDGLVVDVRGNGGGTREILLALGGYFINPRKPAIVGSIAKYKLSKKFDADHLAARYMYEEGWEGWSKRQKSAIRRAKSKFKPTWKAVGEFSDWHYLVLDRTGHESEYFYRKPVVILSDSGCFSATDIFLGALEIFPNVTLVGTKSSGGSARSQSFKLPNSGIEVKCASMASYRPDGRLYDGNGIEVDIEILPQAEDFLTHGGDSQLESALAELGVEDLEEDFMEPLIINNDFDKDASILVHKVIEAVFSGDYESFKSTTVLGMEKKVFKRFMKESGSNKITRVWDSGADDFSDLIKSKFKETFNISQAAIGGNRSFDPANAQIVKCEWHGRDGGDIDVSLISGEMGLRLILDDCFMTPQGALIFDAPIQGMFVPAEQLR